MFLSENVRCLINKRLKTDRKSGNEAGIKQIAIM